MAHERYRRPAWDAITARLDAMDVSLRERADARARDAGLGRERNVWHNALLAYSCGQPWSGVDYSALRDAIRIDASRDRIPRLRSRLYLAYEGSPCCGRFIAPAGHCSQCGGHVREPSGHRSEALHVDYGPRGMVDYCDLDVD